MDINLSAFQEPRGVMRVFQFIFAICAFATTTNYSGEVQFLCKNQVAETYEYSYPFHLVKSYTFNCTGTAADAEKVDILGNFSSDAQFFVATGVLAMLFALGITAIYAKFDEKYKNNAQWPMGDFIITVIIAVLWLSGSAAWANGLSGLKMATYRTPSCQYCQVHSSNFSSLNISVILGFLNFFLWASDLWFLYKETEWFQGKQAAMTSSPTM